MNGRRDLVTDDRGGDSTVNRSQLLLLANPQLKLLLLTAKIFVPLYPHPWVISVTLQIFQSLDQSRPRASARTPPR